MSEIYAVSLSFFGQPFRFLLRKANFDCPLAAFKEFHCLCLNIHMKMYQSPCQNYLEPITSIITIIAEIVLVFMHLLAQLKQVIELSATEGYTFGITFHKKINTNTSQGMLY